MKIAFVDTETTGLDPAEGQVIEIAVVTFNVGATNMSLADSIESKVSTQFFEPPPEVAKINGYDRESWADAPTWSAVWPRARELIQGCVWAGSNPKFDTEFVRHMCFRTEQRLPKLATRHLVDVPTLALDWFLSGDVESLSQPRLCERLGIPGGGHRALTDALQCAMLFAHLTRRSIGQ